MAVRVSVVIPSYKSSAWLEATLDSVVRQTYPYESIEVLVVDDASPDDSADIARKFLARHKLTSRVVALEKNGGASATRNLGWTMASGDWIQFLDQDDLLAPHKIELQARAAELAEDNVAVVYSNWQHLRLEDGQWQPSGPVNAPVVDADPILKTLEQFDFGYVGPTLIRKSFLQRVGGFDEKPNVGEDIDLMLRLAMAGGQFKEARSENAAFFYRLTPNSLSQEYSKSVEPMRNLLRTFKRVEEFLRGQSSDGSLSDPARHALANRYSRFVNFYFEHDRESYDLLMGWLKGLHFQHPTIITPQLRILSRMIGHKDAIRLRLAYRAYIPIKRSKDPKSILTKVDYAGGLPAISMICGHKGVVAGVACLLLMVQGQIAEADTSHLLIASATGILSVFPLLGVAWTRHARLFANRWMTATFVGVCAFFADAVMHHSHYPGPYTEAALTAAIASALCVITSFTAVGRKMDLLAAGFTNC